MVGHLREGGIVLQVPPLLESKQPSPFSKTDKKGLGCVRHFYETGGVTKETMTHSAKAYALSRYFFWEKT